MSFSFFTRPGLEGDVKEPENRQPHLWEAAAKYELPDIHIYLKTYVNIRYFYPICQNTAWIGGLLTENFQEIFARTKENATFLLRRSDF
jgi:hypothetical protein